MRKQVSIYSHTTWKISVCHNKYLILGVPIALAVLIVCIALICNNRGNDNFVIVIEALEGLSLSYISGFIIYFLTTIVPKVSREKKAMLRSEKIIGRIYTKMSKIIECVKFLGEIDEDNNSITEDQLSFLGTLRTGNEDIFFFSDQYCGTHKTTRAPFFDYFNFKTDLPKYKNSFDEDIRKLSFYILDLPEDLIRILGDIENTGLLKALSITALPIASNVSTNNSELIKTFYDYVQLFIRLSEFVESPKSYKYKKMTSEDILRYTAKRDEARKRIAQSGLMFENAVEWYYGALGTSIRV